MLTFGCCWSGSFRTSNIHLAEKDHSAVCDNESMLIVAFDAELHFLRLIKIESLIDSPE